MNWGQAKKLLRLAANRRVVPHGAPTVGPGTAAPAGDGEKGNGATTVASVVSPEREPRPPLELAPVPRAHSLCVASGKGGTGKSVVTASLAALLSLRGRTLIVDADMGVGNAHILQGVSPEHSFVDVAEGRLAVPEIVHTCRDGVDLVSAGSGVSRMAGLSSYEMHLIACGLERLEQSYEHLVVDSAAGVSEQTVAFAAACRCTLLVTTPDLTAMTDAYAFLKVLYARRPEARVLLVVNRVHSPEEGERAAERICGVSDRFLGRGPVWLGSLPEDPAVRTAGNQRSPVVLSDPHAKVSARLRRLCVRVVAELRRDEDPLTSSSGARRVAAPHGMGRQLVEDCGYSSKFVTR